MKCCNIVERVNSGGNDVALYYSITPPIPKLDQLRFKRHGLDVREKTGE